MVYTPFIVVSLSNLQTEDITMLYVNPSSYYLGFSNYIDKIEEIRV